MAIGWSPSGCGGSASEYEAMDFCLERFAAPAPGYTSDSPTGVPHCVNSVASVLQMRVRPILRTICRSVVEVGMVQVSVTRSPLRTARRSEGGFGKSSDGG